MSYYLQDAFETFEGINNHPQHKVGLIVSNLYNQPDAHIGWHSDKMALSSKGGDDEKEMVVVSLSYGKSM
eukprot:3135356-Lingulodinium_polyedra.AAC.1